jgi:hypothetical protein
LYWIEKILVQLLGYNDISVRDQVVVFLNMLYDETDWQLTSAHRPVIRSVGQHFKVNVTVNHDLEKDKHSQIFISLSAPSPIPDVNKTLLTWHKIDARNVRLSLYDKTVFRSLRQKALIQRSPSILVNFGSAVSMIGASL